MPITRRRFLAAGLLASAFPAYPRRGNTGTPRLMQGPMLGAPEADRLRFWLRGSEALDAAVEVARDAEFKQIVGRDSVRLGAADDGCAVLSVAGLMPSTEYHYRIRIDGRPEPYLAESAATLMARTAPPPGARRDFSLAFGSCAHYARDPVQPIWLAVHEQEPDLFLWLGDNIYADSVNPSAIAEEYRRQRGVPAFQSLARGVPQLAIWDDHDYALDDHDRSNPVKLEALRQFRRYWANPSYGLSEAPGVFFRSAYGAVDLFMLDCRYERDPNDAPDTPAKSLLGARQLAWLKEELKASQSERRAVFKLLCCGSNWSDSKGAGGDSWAAFLHERNALFDFIRDEAISGVVLLSGDVHRGELNAIAWSAHGGYDFYDLVSSPLAQAAVPVWDGYRIAAPVREPYAGSPNFGLIRFEFEPEPRLVFTLLDGAGEEVWEPLDLPASLLANGVESWQRKALSSP